MSTGDNRDILEEVRATIRSEPRFGARDGLQMSLDDGALTLDGEVANVAVKKRVLERAAAVPGVDGILDRLRVTPAAHMGDKEIRDHICDALMQEPTLATVAIHEVVNEQLLSLRELPDSQAEICIDVREGIVTLGGNVPSLPQKRLAGVLAWWVPGSRDVINGLGVLSPERESDEETTDAVRMALEKDPFVDASKIRVVTRNADVRLEGLVPTDSEREMAEFDAWYVFGVNKVDNRIEVRP